MLRPPFGIAKEELRKMEKGDFIGESKPSPEFRRLSFLCFSDTVLGMSSIICYFFNPRGELFRVLHAFQTEYSNENLYIAHHRRIRGELMKIYGKPRIETQIWNDDSHNNRPHEWGHAVACGHMSCLIEWEAEGVITQLTLHGGNSRVKHHLVYVDRKRRQETRKEIERDEGGDDSWSKMLGQIADEESVKRGENENSSPGTPAGVDMNGDRAEIKRVSLEIPERRNHPRIEAHHPALYSADVDFAPKVASILDLSIGGTRIGTPYSLISGTGLTMSIAIHPRVIGCKGRVVYVRWRDSDTLEAGVQFEDLSEEDGLYLNRYISSIRAQQNREDGVLN